MITNPIKKVTLTCSSCNTSIRFPVPDDINAIEDLRDTFEYLECPHCRTKFHAGNVANAIADYNIAIKKINSCKNQHDIVLE